ALVVSMANARHEHEYKSFARNPLPDGMSLVAGVIDTTNNYVEHPEVVADRLERIATAVGDPRPLTAGTDCGFDTSAGLGGVVPRATRDRVVASEPAERVVPPVAENPLARVGSNNHIIARRARDLRAGPDNGRRLSGALGPC